LRFSRRERAAYESAKKATISRAKRSDCMRMLDRASVVVYRLTLLAPIDTPGKRICLHARHA
jgi:hypothetical protein